MAVAPARLSRLDHIDRLTTLDDPKWLACYDIEKLNAPILFDAKGDDIQPVAPVRFRQWSMTAKPATDTIYLAKLRPRQAAPDHPTPLTWDWVQCTAFIADNFTVSLTATSRDDGAVWLVLLGGLRAKATYSLECPGAHRDGDTHDPKFRGDDHVAGSFPTNVWRGVVSFQRTPDCLWLATLPDGTAFTLEVWGQELSDRGIEKVCEACQTSRPVAMFARHHKAKDGLQLCCRDCSGTLPPRIGKASLHSASNGRRKRRSTSAGRAVANAVAMAPVGWKACPECVTAKPATAAHFVPDPNTADGLQHRCRDCSGTISGLLWVIGRDAKKSA